VVRFRGRFFTERMTNGRKSSADGAIRTFPLRGITDSPPYLHDGRLLTLDDIVEFFNQVLETNLTAAEKADPGVFLRALQNPPQHVGAQEQK
jgi:cytochrome c peroxidase